MNRCFVCNCKLTELTETVKCTREECGDSFIVCTGCSSKAEARHPNMYGHVLTAPSETSKLDSETSQRTVDAETSQRATYESEMELIRRERALLKRERALLDMEKKHAARSGGGVSALRAARNKFEEEYIPSRVPSTGKTRRSYRSAAPTTPASEEVDIASYMDSRPKWMDEARR